MTAQVHSMPTPFSRSLGATVRALMARHGVTQVNVSQLLGVPQSAVSRRLSGQTPLDINELDTLARFFRITVAELVADAEQPRPEGPDRDMLDTRYARRDSNPQPADMSAARARRNRRLSLPTRKAAS